MSTQNASLEAVLNTLSVGVCVWELGESGEPASLVLRACNHAAAKFLSVEREAVLGKSIGEGFPGSLDTPLPGVFTAAIQDQQAMELGDVPYEDEVVPDSVFAISVTPLAGRRVLVQFTNVTEERRAQAETKRMLEQAELLDGRLGLIEQQKREIQELTAPILELWTGVLTLPLVGRFDQERAEVVREKLLEAISTKQARQVIIDVTGLESIDEGIADELLRMSRAAALLGTKTYFSGISPANALIMAGLDHGLLADTCLRSLQDAMRVVLGR